MNEGVQERRGKWTNTRRTCVNAESSTATWGDGKCYSNTHTEMLMSTGYVFQHLLWKISGKASVQSSPCPQIKPALISVVGLFIYTPIDPRISTTYRLFFRNTLHGPFSCQICFMTSFFFSFSFPFYNKQMVWQAGFFLLTVLSFSKVIDIHGWKGLGPLVV